MSSATDLKNLHHLTPFEKSQNKVIAVLKFEPFGLTVPQLMTKCQLSAKTLNQVLNSIDVNKENGVFTLKDNPPPDLSLNKAQPKKIDVPETKPIVSFKQKMIDMFKSHPEGITLDDALEILECDRIKFDGTLHGVKKTAFPVELRTLDDNSKKYVPILEPIEKIKPTPVVADESQQLPEFSMQSAIDEILHKNTDNLHKNEEITPITEEKPHIPEYFEPKNEYSENLKLSILDECKLMVQERTFKQRDVFLNGEQLNTLLKQLFGLELVSWKTTGARVDGVHLSDIQTMV